MRSTTIAVLLALPLGAVHAQTLTITDGSGGVILQTGLNTPHPYADGTLRVQRSADGALIYVSAGPQPWTVDCAVTAPPPSPRPTLLVLDGAYYPTLDQGSFGVGTSTINGSFLNCRRRSTGAALPAASLPRLVLGTQWDLTLAAPLELEYTPEFNLLHAVSVFGDVECDNNVPAPDRIFTQGFE